MSAVPFSNAASLALCCAPYLCVRCHPRQNGQYKTRSGIPRSSSHRFFISFAFFSVGYRSFLLQKRYSSRRECIIENALSLALGVFFLCFSTLAQNFSCSFLLLLFLTASGQAIVFGPSADCGQGCPLFSRQVYIVVPSGCF